MAANIRTVYRYFPIAERDRQWGIYATTVGQCQMPPSATYPPQGHPKSYNFNPQIGRCLRDYQILYISSGTGWFKSVESGRVQVKPGNVFILFPGVWHSYAPNPSSGWNEYWVGFDGNLAQRLLRKGFFTPSHPVFYISEEDKLLFLFNDLLKTAHSNQPAMQQIMSATIMRILALLYSIQQSELAGDDRALQIIHTATIRMREAGGDQISIAELARELKVGYRWLRRAFTHYSGLSPHQYLLEIRLARARDLLSQTSLSVKEIATNVGFTDAHYFVRLFHNKVGLAPGEWRERIKKERAKLELNSKSARPK
jgi:AraC-like DNA-binding protein